MTKTVTHKGGCHCGAVSYEFDGPAVIDAVYCNCSICAATGFLHYFVTNDQIRFAEGSLDAMTDYQFNTKTAHHLFCKTCGIKSVYVPRSHPDGYSINVNCLDKSVIEDVRVEDFDGQNWEASIGALKNS